MAIKTVIQAAYLQKTIAIENDEVVMENGKVKWIYKREEVPIHYWCARDEALKRFEAEGIPWTIVNISEFEYQTWWDKIKSMFRRN